MMRLEKIASLRSGEAALTGAIVCHSENRKTEEKFFAAVRDELNKVCDAIAGAVDAESCALFFVTEDLLHQDSQFMVMRGASGNFRKMLEFAVHASEPTEVKGYAYPSLRHQLGRGTAHETVIKSWPVTNQIWHLGDGRMANSNHAMNILANYPDQSYRLGSGDKLVYPNLGNLSSVFRTMVAIPIFARGGPTQAKERAADSSSSPHRDDRSEFLSRYRVIGILKAENKKPQRSLGRFSDLLASNDDQQCPKAVNEKLQEWYSKQGEQALKRLMDLFDADPQKENEEGFNLLNNPSSGLQGDIIEKKKQGSQPDIETIDYLTERFEAQFSQQDAELLVSLAMQIGRILARRTIEHASQHNIVISEHEVGTLNVRYKDVDQLESFFFASDCLRIELERCFRSLMTESEYERQREIYRAGVEHRIQPRGPIREVSSRLKHPVSLFRKLLNKHEELERQTEARILTLHGVPVRMNNCGPLTEQQIVANGPATLFVPKTAYHESASAGMCLDLGVDGGPRTADQGMRDVNVTQKPEKRHWVRHASLVQRILDLYKVDDLAGVRVVSDYLSDLSFVMDQLRARHQGWGLEIATVDEALEVAKKGGYRGVHVTVKADVRSLLPASTAMLLQDALGVERGQRLEIPCEIQLRTRLQDSEALKSHSLTYKQEQEVDEPMLELLQIHSNQLHQAEKNADIIRDHVEALRRPDDFGERRMLNYLRPRLTRDGFTLVEFGLACAKRIHEHDLRLSGLPYLSHILGTCQRLIYNFGVTSPEMLFLALVRDLWMNPSNNIKQRLESGNQSQGHHYSKRDFQVDLSDAASLGGEDKPSEILSYFGARLNWKECLEGFPRWFLGILQSFRQFWRDCHIERPDDRGERRIKRLKDLRRELEEAAESHGESAHLDEWVQRAFVLEAAILVSRLQELPDEPNRRRAEEQFRSAYEELEIITSNLPSAPRKMAIVEEVTKVFREAAEKLQVEIPINWYR